MPTNAGDLLEDYLIFGEFEKCPYRSSGSIEPNNTDEF